MPALEPWTPDFDDSDDEYDDDPVGNEEGEITNDLVNTRTE